MDVFSELTNLAAAPADDREGRAWQLLASTESDADFDVALDCALENELVPMEVGAAIRGRASQPPAAHSYINPTDGTQLVWIPPGPFPRNRFQGPLNIAGFFLARHPVTNRQFQQFLEATGYEPPADHPDPDRFLRHFSQNALQGGQEDHPVVFVSMTDAWHYCEWAGLTLPTEEQWEKAARGVDGRMYPWGNQFPWDWRRQRNFELAQVGRRDTCPVGSFPRTRTAYGCEDMLGNVSEWCWVGQQSVYYDAPNVPVRSSAELSGDDRYGMVRGACFLRSLWGDGLPLHHRRRLSAARRNRWVGFRPALSLSRSMQSAGVGEADVQ